MITLSRYTTDANGTFGKLLDALGLFLCYTVERAYTGDHPCIPAGVYMVQPYNSPTKGDVWQVQNVPGRTYIEIHPANDEDDLLGCIGVGNSLGKVNGLPAVLDSQNTFKMLKSVLPASFQLSITENFLCPQPPQPPQSALS